MLTFHSKDCCYFSPCLVFTAVILTKKRMGGVKYNVHFGFWNKPLLICDWNLFLKPSDLLTCGVHGLKYRRNTNQSPVVVFLFWKSTRFSVPFLRLISCQLHLLCGNWNVLPAIECQNRLGAYLWRSRRSLFGYVPRRFWWERSHWLEWLWFTMTGATQPRRVGSTPGGTQGFQRGWEAQSSWSRPGVEQQREIGQILISAFLLRM